MFSNARGLSIDKKPLGDLTAKAETRGQEVVFDLTSDHSTAADAPALA